VHSVVVDHNAPSPVFWVTIFFLELRMTVEMEHFLRQVKSGKLAFSCPNSRESTESFQTVARIALEAKRLGYVGEVFASSHRCYGVLMYDFVRIKRGLTLHALNCLSGSEVT
jgi:hypothetical protein